MSDAKKTQKQAVYVGPWVLGVNSMFHPSEVPKTSLGWGENLLLRGGLAQTRPGMRLLSTIPGTNLQGFATFQPKNGLATILAAVDGLIYTAKPPYSTFVAIPGLQFRADAEIINFKKCLQSVKRKSDGTIVAQTPIEMVIIQDGFTVPAFWDGTNARHLNPEIKEPPIGLWMEWIASRLWVASDSRVYASDIANPLSFNEDTYLATRSAFELPEACTGLIATADQRGLLAFTADTTTGLQANIRDRSQWQSTPEFQRTLFNSIGCVAGRSVINHYGSTRWFSRGGWITLDAALYSQRTAKVATADGFMMRSKRNLAPNLSKICAIGYENLTFVSVPSGSGKNAHTWVWDEMPIGEASQGGVWCGAWTGFRPVGWGKAIIGGRERLYCGSNGAKLKNDTNVHIWEACKDDRTDNGGRIACQMETCGIFDSDREKFRYAELDLVEILGVVDIQVYFGGIRGPWRKILDTTIQAEIGCFGSAQLPIIEYNSVIQSFKPQSRFLRTQEFSASGICSGVEGDDSPHADKGFQILVQWRGRMGIKGINIITEEIADKDKGETCTDGESAEHNAINEAGEDVV